jgi:hypothetical protein
MVYCLLVRLRSKCSLKTTNHQRLGIHFQFTPNFYSIKKIFPLKKVQDQANWYLDLLMIMKISRWG